MPGIDVHVTVPENKVSELLAYAASLWNTGTLIATEDVTI